ncbi:hypothetical protein OK016_16620 [Vibrio chagasii]|nr:hypothetical protein [Vibrio chagasii]
MLVKMKRFATGADIHEGLEDTWVIFENRLKHHQLEKHYDTTLPALLQPLALQQVWTNLLSNALDASIRAWRVFINTPNKTKDNQMFLVADIRHRHWNRAGRHQLYFQPKLYD